MKEMMERTSSHAGAPLEGYLCQLGMREGVRRSGVKAEVFRDRIQRFWRKPGMTGEVERGYKCASGLSQRRQDRSGEPRERRKVKLTPQLAIKD